MKILLIDQQFSPLTLEQDLQTLYNLYLKACEKKTEFQKLLHLKAKNLQLFLDKCVQLTKDIRFISFRRDRQVFEVRLTRSKKRINLGQYVSFDDACDALNEWFKLEKQNNEN